MQVSSSLMYRFGFFAHTINVPPPSDKSIPAWPHLVAGRLIVHTHPETQICRVEGKERMLVVVGLMYSVVDQDIDVLLQALADNVNWSCAEFLLQVSGRFALLVQEGGGMQLYHDAFGSRSVFYSLAHPGYIASHARLLAEMMGAKKEQSVVDFLSREEYKARSVKYLPGDQSLWEGICALIPNNYLCLESSTCVRYWPLKPKTAATFKQFSAVYDSHIKGLISAIRNQFVLVGITGGIDTRAVFAAMSKYDLPFSGVTWRGGYIEEKEIAPIDEIVALLGMEHSYIDTKRAFDPEVARIAGINSGGARGGSRLTAQMHTDYGNGSGVAVRGYGGEIIRGFYNISRSPMADLSAASLAKAYGSSIRDVNPSQDYLDYVEAMFVAFRERANYTGLERFGFDPSDIFYWEHRMGVWASGMLNEGDAALYTLVGINGRRLFETGFGLEDKVRLTKAVLARIIDEYNPELAAVRYF